MGIFDKLKRAFGEASKAEAARTADARIADFWTFWAAHRDALAEVMGQRPSDALIAAVAGAVHGLHEDLEWEFGPGARAPHSFTVTGHGDPTLRHLAERWRAAAPRDPTFDFFATRQPTAIDARALVDRVAQTAAIGEDQWVVGDSEADDGEPLIFLVNLAVKRWDFGLRILL